MSLTTMAYFRSWASTETSSGSPVCGRWRDGERRV